MSVGYLQTMAKVETMREALRDLVEHFFEIEEADEWCPVCASKECDRWAFVRELLGKP